MAVLAMKQIQVCALMGHKKALMEFVQRKGVVQLRDGLPQDEVFARPDPAAACAGFQRTIAAARQALEVLDKYAPAKGSPLAFLEGRRALSPGRLTDCVQRRDEIAQQAAHINRLAAQTDEALAQVPRLTAQLQTLEPWLSLDLPLDFKGTARTKAFIGSFAGEHTQQALLEAIPAPPQLPYDLTVISHSKEQTCVFVLCRREDEASMDAALRSAGFALPPLTGSLNPTAQKKAWEDEIAACQAQAAQNAAALSALGSSREDLKLLIDYCTLRREKYAAFDKLAQSRHVFLFSGYVPAPDAPALAKALEERFEAVVELSDPAPEAQTPVALRNNGFAAPMEGVLSSYSFPGKTEFDPSFMMAVFYYFLFGLMLSDAGYGLLMVIVCGILLAKFKNMETGLRKSLTMFFYSGISTTFWGIMYGSWFGDAPAVIAKTFFNSDFAIDPIWVNPITCPMQMLMFCLGVGIIHLFFGLACKGYMLVRDKDWLGLVADVLAWYALIGGLVLFALSSPSFLSIVQLQLSLPPVLGTAGKWAAVAGAVLVVAFGGRDSSSIALRLVKGLYALYNATGWLGDILSYSRLLALGLATGVIGQVVNQMGSMGGNTPVGIVMFILVFLVGHTLNIAINLLGAYVHTNRLQFVEFFGKFYEGGGEEFAPFAAHTQYYKISEVK